MNKGLLFLGLIVMIYLIIREITKRRKQKAIEKLGKEVREKLKNDWNAGRTDARRIMGELNYIIDEINEYWEQNEYFRKSYQEAGGSNPAIFEGYNSFMSGKFLQSKEAKREERRIKEEAKLFKITKKTLDDYIKKEWNPRIEILKENSINYYSDKELRDAFTQFCNADIEIQQLTIEGEKIQELNKTLKVAGIVLVATTGLALGAMRAVNRSVNRQSLLNNLGV